MAVARSDKRPQDLKSYILGRKDSPNRKAAPGDEVPAIALLVAVHENGLNITAAARQLHTSQPGVSRQLKLLEEELGFQLFEREGRALTQDHRRGRGNHFARHQHSAGNAKYPPHFRGAAQVRRRHFIDRHHSYPGALRIAARDPRISHQVSEGAAASAPGHVGTNSRDGGARPCRFRHRHRLRGTISRIWCGCPCIAGIGR